MSLVPLKPVLDAARAGGYAQGAFNVNAVCQAKAAIEVHEIALRLEHTTDDGSAKRGVVDVGITREKDYVQLIPTTQLTFLLGSWEEISKSVFFQCGLF